MKQNDRTSGAAIASGAQISFGASGVSGASGAAGWLLVFGLALTTLGLVTAPAGTAQTQPPVTAGGGGALPTSPGYGTADSNDQMIAVTGIDVTGSSILYVIDTQHRQLAVYQATSGSASSMGLKFIAGRNIDLDLQVYGFNDKSELSYRQMAEKFEKNPSKDR
jgi:hypothetical protein